MTTVGYGDISAETNSEMAFSIVAMASGGIFYGYMIANISNLVNNKDQNDRRYVEKMNEIRAYMGARRVPKDLRRKMMSYYKHYFATKTALNESRILNDLPQGLQKAMRIHLAQDTLDRFVWRLFRSRSVDCVGTSCTVLQALLLHPLPTHAMFMLAAVFLFSRA